LKEKEKVKIYLTYTYPFFLAHPRQRLSWAFLIEKCTASVCPSVRMSLTFHIVNVFFRTTACTVTKLTTIIPFGVLKKCCIFLKRLDIRYGCTCLLLAETFSTSFPDLLHVKTCQKCFSKESQRSVVSGSKNQNGHPSLLLTETCLIFSPKQYKVTRLARNFPPHDMKKCCYLE
jgi:hypothetical protein